MLLFPIPKKKSQTLLFVFHHKLVCKEIHKSSEIEIESETRENYKINKLLKSWFLDNSEFY